MMHKANNTLLFILFATSIHSCRWATAKLLHNAIRPTRKEISTGTVDERQSFLCLVKSSRCVQRQRRPNVPQFDRAVVAGGGQVIGIVPRPLHRGDPLFVARSKGLVGNQLDEVGRFLLVFVATGSHVPEPHGAIGMPRGDNAAGMVGGVEATDDARSIQGQQTVLSLYVPDFETVVPTAGDELSW